MTRRTLALAAPLALVTGVLWAADPGADAPGSPKPADDAPAKPAADKPVAPKPADLATRLRVRQNLKNVLLALHAYHDANDALPRDVADANGTPLLSWRVALLPHLDQQELYHEFKLTEPWDSEHNKPLLAKMPDVFKAGGEAKGAGKTYFQGLAGAGALFEPGKSFGLQAVTDGTSNTLAVLAAGPAVEWTRPADLAFDWTNPAVPPSPYSNVLIGATADGAVYQFAPDLDPGLFSRLAAVADGNVVDLTTAVVPLKAETKEDEAFAADLVKKNEAAAKEAGDLLAERQKLLAAAAKKRAATALKDLDLEALTTDQERLAKLLKDLKAETDKLKALMKDEK